MTNARIASASKRVGRLKLVNLLLLFPFIGLLWVPFYNRTEPSVFGIPFFYWYQFLWVLLVSLVIYAVHVLTDGVPADDLQSDQGDPP